MLSDEPGADARLEFDGNRFAADLAEPAPQIANAGDRLPALRTAAQVPLDLLPPVLADLAVEAGAQDRARLLTSHGALLVRAARGSTCVILPCRGRAAT